MKRQDWDAAVQAENVWLWLQLSSTIWRSKLAGGLHGDSSASHALTELIVQRVLHTQQLDHNCRHCMCTLATLPEED